MVGAKTTGKLAAEPELPLDHVIAHIGYAIDNTTKTRAIFEINKGANKLPIDVNATVPHDQRRVPFQNMIYIADGPSDIPAFSVLNQNGGRTYAVYRPGSEKEFDQVSDLQEQGRGISFAQADYGANGAAHLMIRRGVLKIAQRIVSDRQRLLSSTVSTPPRHIIEEVAVVASSSPNVGNDQSVAAI